jgi:DNA (cytosine-5)-methyltransferase 1
MYIDLFAGCGGLSLGLHKAGLTGLFAVEKNEAAFSTLKYNLIERQPHFKWPEWLEVTNIDINELICSKRQELISLRGHVSLVVGGPPCQGFSLAGQRKKNDIRNQLMNAYIEFVKLVQPEMLFFENVHGFTIGFTQENNPKYKSIPYSEKLIKALENEGYNIDHKMITMSDYGVPQKRTRFILFGIKNGNPKKFFERLEKGRTQFLSRKGYSMPVTIKEAIGDLEERHGKTVSKDSKGYFNGVYGKIESPYQKVMRCEIAKSAIPDSHRFAKQHKETIELLKKLMEVSNNAVKISPRQKLVEGLKKRSVTPLKPHCICLTITSIPDDFVHYSEPRIMTVREHARIQSFPDDFEFKGKYTTGGQRRKTEVPRFTQVANAIPPIFSEQVGIVLKEVNVWKNEKN